MEMSIKMNRMTLGVILASTTLTVMAGAIISPVLNLMREGLGADPSSAALIITTHGIFIAICSPLVGVLIDKMGTRRPYVMGLFFYGITGGAGLVINNYWLLILSRVFFGMAVAAVFTAITVMILNLYKGADRNKVMGWRGSCNSFGGIIWPLLGGYLGGFSWHLPFAAYLAGIPLGVLALRAIPEVYHRENTVAGDADQKKSVFQIVKSVPVLFIIYGLTFWSFTLLYTLVVFLPPTLETMGITKPFYIGLFISVSALSAGLTSLLYGKIRERLSYKWIIVLALALWAFGFMTISQVTLVWPIVLSILLYGMGQGLVMPAIMVWVGESVPLAFRGRMTSYLATFGFVGQFCAPLIFRPVVMYFGLNSAFLTAGSVCVILFFLFIIFMKR